MLILLSGTPPVKEYLFTMTKLGSQDFSVHLIRMQTCHCLNQEAELIVKRTQE